MLLDTIIRGNVVEFTVTFLDGSGNAIEPSSAEVKVNFLNSEGVRETIAVVMNSTTAGWFATWDSSVAEPARVYWSAVSSSPVSAKDGAFELAANLANLGTVTP